MAAKVIVVAPHEYSRDRHGRIGARVGRVLGRVNSIGIRVMVCVVVGMRKKAARPLGRCL
jgi:hypothetical protein